MPTHHNTRKVTVMSTPDNTPIPPAAPASVPPAGPGMPPPVEQRRSSTRWLIPTLGAVAAMGIGLVGGIAIGQNTASARPAASGFSRQFGAATGDGTGTGTGARTFGAGGFTTGTVVSVSGNTLVVKSAAGTDVTVTTTPATKVTKQRTVKLSDLSAGERVTAIGTPGSNGAITATTISEGATGFGGRFARPGAGGRGAGAGSGTGASTSGTNG